MECANPAPVAQCGCARCARAALAEARREVARLQRAEATFHEEYRQQCDAKTKALHIEVERLRAETHKDAELAKAKQTLNLVHPAVDGSLSEVAKAKADQIVGLLNETTVLGGRLAQVESELAAFQPYLKDGETPIERLERERHDNDTLLTLLAHSQRDAEAARSDRDRFQRDLA